MPRPGPVSASQPATTPGTRHGVDAAPRHLLDSLPGQKGDVEPGGRPAARVEPQELARLGHVDDGEEIAPDAVAGGLHEADRRVGGDGGIDGVAAALEDRHARSRGERLARGDDAVLRRDDGAPDGDLGILGERIESEDHG